MEYEVETKCIHGESHHCEDEYRSISYPIYQTTSFSHIRPGHNESGFDYSRESNPTRAYLEETVSALEGAKDSVAFASGMAAIATCFELFRPGDHIICTEDLYGGVVRLVHVISEKNGITVDFVDTGNIAALKEKIRPNTKAIYLETPSNPMMHVSDIAECARLAHDAGALLIVDNTFLSPYFQNPIALGADIVVHSGSKFISGHNDVICGFLCLAKEELSERVRLLSKTIGGTLSPLECWLVLRGLKTLHLRMERHEQNAGIIADWLKKQACVKKVYYVGLPEHPGHDIVKKQSKGFGSMISFEVESEEKARSILEKVRLITFAESLGGTESLLTYPIVQTHPDVPEHIREKLGINRSLLRLSVGLENVNDLIHDLENAFGE